MGKFYKPVIGVLLAALVLSGSYIQNLPERGPVVDLVTQVEIVFRQEQTTLSRRYTHPQKIQPVLHYLRLLRYKGRAQTDPEKIVGEAFDITLHYSGGGQKIYRQRANRYLSKNGHAWERIDPDHARYLRSLILAIPSDH